MILKEIANKVKKEYRLSESEFLKQLLREFLISHKRDIEADILDIMSKHSINSMEELEDTVKAVHEHPQWEDLIVLENLTYKLQEIKSDIRALS